MLFGGHNTREMVLFALALLTSCAFAQSPPGNTKVVLDKETFRFFYNEMQQTADNVSLTVDHLIPGRSAAYPAAGIILCFVAPEAWHSAVNDPPPITLVGASRQGEPQAARPYSVRIAVHRLVFPKNEPELIYELAHELAHVKMDAQYDNYLVETFAVAVALRVLQELRPDPVRKTYIDHYTQHLPQPIRSAIDRRDWKEAILYWQSEIPHQKLTPFGQWNFSFATLGALVLEAYQQPVWANLLDAAAISDHCLLSNGMTPRIADAAEFKTCRPTIQDMIKLGPALKALGYPQLLPRVR